MVVIHLVRDVLRVVGSCFGLLQPLLGCFLDGPYALAGLRPAEIFAVGLLAFGPVPTHEVIGRDGLEKLFGVDSGSIHLGVLMRGKEGLRAGKGIEGHFNLPLSSEHLLVHISDPVFLGGR